MKALKFVKNNLFLITVLLIYGIMLIVIPEKAIASGKNSTYYILEMLKIMPVILILTSLIDTWIPKKVIMKGLGEKSKLKGVILALALGSLSAGPIYVAFPMCRMLFKKGASINNIVIILSAWAVVKVPMLINESKFLGLEFMTVRWILTIISIVVMGALVSQIVKRKDIPTESMEAGTGKQEILIEAEYCTGCEICVNLMPMHFEMLDKKAGVLMSDISMGNAGEKLKTVIEKCPGDAIQYKD